MRCCTAGILQDSDEDVRNAALAVLKQLPSEAKVATARNLTPSSVSRVDILATLDVATLEDYGFVADAYTSNVVELLKMLDDANGTTAGEGGPGCAQ